MKEQFLQQKKHIRPGKAYSIFTDSFSSVQCRRHEKRKYFDKEQNVFKM